MPSTTRELEYAITTARSILAELDDPDPDSDIAYGQFGSDWPDVLADVVRVLLAHPQPPCATTDPDTSRTMPRLEVVTYRDPDGDTSLRLFADGTEADPDLYAWCDIDPGRGHTLSEWRDTREWHARRASDAAADAIRQGYRDGEDTDYITTPSTGAVDSVPSRDSMT